MSALDDSTANETRPSGIGPGERLQAARIQQGLSLEDVADRMHLSPSILEALEENNFEEITAPIFVKGYLRAYARIVSLDEDDMILQYQEFFSEEDPPISSTSNMTPELSVTDARIKWTTYLVILVLAVLLGAWWWNKEKSEESTISLDSQTEEAAPAAAEVASSSIQAASESDTQALATEPVETAPEPVEAVPEPVEAMPEPVESIEAESPEQQESMAAAETAPMAEADTGLTESATMQSADAGDETVLESATEEEVETAAVDNLPTLIAPSGSDRLQIIVNADTWADIKDSSGYQMVYDLLRAGQSLELTGAAPFSVFLGNGHGVEIRINDEDFNFFNRIRDDNTARLRIGG